MESYSQDLRTHLSALCEVAHLLVQEQRAYHQKMINSRHPDPRTYSVGNTVFAYCAIRSNATKGYVDKLQYEFTGPWCITVALKGTSYKLEHCFTPSRKEKGTPLTYPRTQPSSYHLKPVNGPNTWYSRFHKPIAAHPFKEASIKRLTLISPFKVTAHFLTTDQAFAFHWPSLLELNNKIISFPWLSEEEQRQFLLGDTISALLVM